jgi:hypothetical protein
MVGCKQRTTSSRSIAMQDIFNGRLIRVVAAMEKKLVQPRHGNPKVKILR